LVTDLIFDFFGTLVAYTPGHLHDEPYHHTHAFLCDHGFPIAYPTFVTQFSTVFAALEQEAQQTAREFPMDAVGQAFFMAAFGVTVPDPLLRAFVAIYIQEWSRAIVVLPGLPAMLTRLARRFRLSIVSNTHYPPLIHDTLQLMGCTSHFRTIITSVAVGMRKPHPLPFQVALEQLAIPATAAVYVGDTYVDDYQGATAVQIPCVLIDPSDRYPQIPNRIRSVLDLESVLAG
jgi:putative hydrolase of the HAD superfamily